MWVLRIALEALGGLAGKLGGYLSLGGIAAAALAAVFFWGVNVGDEAARADQLRAELAAERAKAERLATLRDAQDQRIADLENALRTIDNETNPVEADGRACPLSTDYRLRLADSYSD